MTHASPTFRRFLIHLRPCRHTERAEDRKIKKISAWNAAFGLLFY